MNPFEAQQQAWLDSFEFEILKNQFTAIVLEYDTLYNTDEFLNLMGGEFAWAPASSKFHGSHFGGLLQHSLKVFEYLKLTIDNSQAFKLAILHDLCKLGIYHGEITNYWKAFTDVEREDYKLEHGKYPKNKGAAKERLSWKVQDSFPIGHGEKSIIIALQKGFELSEEEMVAIRWHMAFDDREWFANRNNVHKQYYTIVKALQRADQDATQEESV